MCWSDLSILAVESWLVHGPCLVNFDVSFRMVVILSMYPSSEDEPGRKPLWPENEPQACLLHCKGWTLRLDLEPCIGSIACTGWDYIYIGETGQTTRVQCFTQVARKMQTDWPFSRCGSCAPRGRQDEFRQPCTGSFRQRQDTGVQTSEGSASALLHGKKWTKTKNWNLSHFGSVFFS